MAKAQHRRKNSKRRIVTMTGIMAGSAGAVALVTLGMSGVGSSAFNSTVTPAPVAVNAATVSLTTGATDTLSGATVANMIPGDYTEQVANLKNGGSANFGSVTIGTEVCDTSSTCTPSSTTTGNNLITGTNGLTLEAQTCSVAWTASGTTAPITYTCSGTKTTALAATPINTLDGTPSTLTFPSTSVLTAKTGESYMMFTVALGSSASNTDQGLTDNVSFGFTATTAAPGAIS